MFFFICDVFKKWLNLIRSYLIRTIPRYLSQYWLWVKNKQKISLEKHEKKLIYIISKIES